MSWVFSRSPRPLLRPAGAVPVEQHDQWEAGDRRYLPEGSMTELMIVDQRVSDIIWDMVLLPELTAA